MINDGPSGQTAYLETRTNHYIRLVQWSAWLAGLVLFGMLAIFPKSGLILFWNFVIPVAPALLVFATGFWRNICPLAFSNLFPRRLGWSARRKISSSLLGKFSLLSVISFFLIVPLRHPLFNHSGLATAILLFVLVLAGLFSGIWFDWKSGWCSSLCPVHPIEKMYGQRNGQTLLNWHCSQCSNCVIPCPDSTPGIQPRSSRKTPEDRISGWLLAGGLPGFIWGWFQVPDTSADLYSFGMAYLLPFSGMIISLLLFSLLLRSLSRSLEERIIQLFAAASVSCYYWYRIPALFGFCEYDTDGVLWDIHRFFPFWAVYFVTIPLALLFFWWFMIRPVKKYNWLIRPPRIRKKSA